MELQQLPEDVVDAITWYIKQQSGISPLCSVNKACAVVFKLPIPHLMKSGNAGAVLLRVVAQRPKMFLHYALQHNAPASVLRAAALAYPEELLVGNWKGQLPLHVAVETSATEERVVALLVANPVAALHQDRLGMLPIHYVQCRTTPGTVQALLNHPASAEMVAMPCHQHRLALHRAIGKGMPTPVVLQLVAANPTTVMARDRGRAVAVELAVMHGPKACASLVEHLLRHYPLAASQSTPTSVHWSRFYNQGEMREWQQTLEVLLQEMESCDIAQKMVAALQPLLGVTMLNMQHVPLCWLAELMNCPQEITGAIRERQQALDGFVAAPNPLHRVKEVWSLWTHPWSNRLYPLLQPQQKLDGQRELHRNLEWQRRRQRQLDLEAQQVQLRLPLCEGGRQEAIAGAGAVPIGIMWQQEGGEVATPVDVVARWQQEERAAEEADTIIIRGQRFSFVHMSVENYGEQPLQTPHYRRTRATAPAHTT